MARPRSFQPEETLKQIKALFWQRGYEATSMSDIEQATGLKKQSLYRVFGDKRAMYMASLKDYDQDEISAFSHILSDDSQSARQRIIIFSIISCKKQKMASVRGVFCVMPRLMKPVFMMAQKKWCNPC